MPGSEPLPADPPGGEAWRPGRIALFLALGLVLYAALFAGSEALVRRTGDRNPFFRIAQAPAEVDWLVLGASHAMPLDFDDAGAMIEAATGRRPLNLGVTGAGPFVWRLVAERFLADHRARGALVVVDAFGFRDRRWNEERPGDSDLLPRIPWDLRSLAVLARAVPRGLPPATLADYASGFSKINNRDRFAPDSWEAEARFDLAPRPSASAARARIAYLYPEGAAEAALPRYLDDLAALIALLEGQGVRVVLLRPPLPDSFRALLPGEEAFSARLAALAEAAGVALVDHSTLLPENRYYLDPDHLNRAGVAAWLEGGLAGLLRR